MAYKILLKSNPKIKCFIDSDSKLHISVKELGLNDRAISTLSQVGIDLIGELLLASGGKYVYIPGIGRNRIERIDIRLKEIGLDVEEFREKTVYRYGFRRYTSLFLINSGIILEGDLLDTTALELFELLNEDYKLTENYISEFRRKNVVLKSSDEDKLLFDINDLSNRVKNALKIDGIYKLTQILRLELNKELKFEHLGPVSMIELYEFVFRHKNCKS